jgi:phage FluMu protein Com
LLVSTQRKIVLRCPLCGRLDFHQISFFDFSGHTPVQIHCKCGFQKLVINTKDYQNFTLQLPCLICEEVHILKFKQYELLEQPLSILRCVETGQELGYIGVEASVDRIITQKQDDMGSIINNLGFEDYFTNPQVMFEILNKLHQIADEDNLFCSCGNNQIEIDVFPEKLELRCPYCQSIHIIYAETIEDLYMVKKVKLIVMTEKGFTSFDSSKVHPNLKS